MKRDLDARRERLARAIDASEQVRHLFAHPSVAAFFETEERRLIEVMATAAPTDDDTRRGAALELAALRKVRNHATTTISSGHEALKRLELTDV